MELGYVDQNRDALDAEKTVFEEISGGNDNLKLGKRKVALPRLRRPASTSQGADQQKKVGQLSGGERNRVHLAKTARSRRQPAAARRTDQRPRRRHAAGLEEAILNFGGCVVVISHDRWFLDRIATHILAFEGDSDVVWCEGNYQAYEADRNRRLGADADQPHRIKYKPLTRIERSGF